MIPKAVDIMKMRVMGAKFDFGRAMGEAVAPLKWGWGMSGAPYIESVRRERTEKSIEEGTNWLNNRIDRIFGKISGKKTNG